MQKAVSVNLVYGIHLLHSIQPGSTAYSLLYYAVHTRVLEARHRSGCPLWEEDPSMILIPAHRWPSSSSKRSSQSGKQCLLQQAMSAAASNAINSDVNLSDWKWSSKFGLPVSKKYLNIKHSLQTIMKFKFAKTTAMSCSDNYNLWRFV